MQNLIVIKVGGNALTELTADFYQTLSAWRAQGKQILLVHGGGNEISRYAELLQLPIIKQDGIRVTDAETLNVTKMALMGLVQPLILQQLSAHGLPALGLNAATNGLLLGDYLDKAKFAAVGQIQAVNQAFLQNILPHFIGVLAPLAMTAQGDWLNVNGDTAAANIATLLDAEKLYLLTDVEGVLEQGKLIKTLTHSEATELIEQGIITQGMQPKITAAFSAKQGGVAQVQICGQLSVAGTQII
ncbi:acetylglutamate kinase [Haemophilus pittmaniae HK 85]|uniref:Acetylglutamate kinase n=1 Tax=Haemophilus pittmaniae HK 85 TaxID=1035188 RepID=F9Q707_9PAST|nr:acetylglutamate kinase [Haemophilus pittmaniae]EGV07467.1 acetylglutamate kinase [Haemophilus pittmaniae HK 85]SNV55641.1 acetylglutamate kinase [Haemophilus pittmaniae]